MNTELSIKTACCSEYKRLLEECQTALRTWDGRRDEIYQSRLRARKFDDELRRLQAKYARALNFLQKHAHDCTLCQLASGIGEGDSDSNSNPLPRERTVHLLSGDAILIDQL